uniref:G-protein coupled receptors family 1 profile domain-containing protein n=1 Tax=Gouania willdenowi TaxID=441366 RepID=A0A8C5GTK3_GOUWI
VNQTVSEGGPVLRSSLHIPVLELVRFSALMIIVVSYNDISVFLSNSSRKLHTPTNFLLLSLAVSDFSVGFVWVLLILLIDGCWFLGAGWCVFNTVLGYVATSASIGTVVLISVDRYVAVYDPMHYQTKVTKNRANICIVLCWLKLFIIFKVKTNLGIFYSGLILFQRKLMCIIHKHSWWSY